MSEWCKYINRKLVLLILTGTILLVLTTCSKSEKEEMHTIDIRSGCIYPQAIPLSSITDSVEIIHFSDPFYRDKVLLLDSIIVVESKKSCLLFDRKGKYIKEIARKGNAPDEYPNCLALNEWNGNIYITDHNGVTKVYTLDGQFLETFLCPIDFLSTIGVLNEKEFVGYRINYKGNEKERMIFYGKDTVFNRLSYQKEYTEPKNYFFFRKDGHFVRTPHSLLMKELLNDTIYQVSSATHNIEPAYLLELDSLRGDESLRYSLENPEFELFRYTPYIMLLGEHNSTCWFTTVYSSYEQQKQIYATHCYDRKTNKVYSMELKMSLKDMGKDSQLLYDSTQYTPPSVNWDNFFPEQMSTDGRYLMSYRGNDILVIARLKKNPIAILQPDTNLRWHKVLLPLIILLILASTYFYFRHKKIRQALKQIKKQLSSNEEILKHYHIELEKMRKSSTETTASIQKSAELEQQIYLLEIQNEELKQHLAVREQKKQKTETERTHLSVSDEGYNLFIKLKAEPSYVFIGEKEHEHLCRITDKLYRQFATRLQTTYQELTKHDIETCCLLKAGLTNQELSIIFNNTPAAITKSKNRIKKRIGLNGDTNLDSFLQEF